MKATYELSSSQTFASKRTRIGWDATHGGAAGSGSRLIGGFKDLAFPLNAGRDALIVEGGCPRVITSSLRVLL